ncbi:hypothetical protein D3C75_848830 [compost metagenome]
MQLPVFHNIFTGGMQPALSFAPGRRLGAHSHFFFQMNPPLKSYFIDFTSRKTRFGSIRLVSECVIALSTRVDHRAHWPVLNRYTSVFCVQIARFAGGNPSWDGLNSAVFANGYIPEAMLIAETAAPSGMDHAAVFFLGLPGDPASLSPWGPLLPSASLCFPLSVPTSPDQEVSPSGKSELNTLENSNFEGLGGKSKLKNAIFPCTEGNGLD